MEKIGSLLSNNNLFENIIYFFLALPSLFLLTNRYPYLAISSILIIVVFGIVFLLLKREFAKYHIDILLILSIIYIYLTSSYFISNQTLSNYFSYRFLRYDGNFFFNYIAFFALAIPYFDYKRVLNIFSKILFFTFTFVSVIGIIEYFSKKFVLFFGTQNNEIVFLVLNNAHNATGSVYAIVCVLLLAFLLLEKNKYSRFIYIFCLVICLAGLLLTRSRGSYIGFVVGAFIVIWIFYRSFIKFFLSIFIMISVSIPIIYFTRTFDRIRMIFDLSEKNIHIRFYLWQKAWDLFTRSPIFGIGFGRYNDIDYVGGKIYDPALFRDYLNVISFYVEPNYVFNFAHAHNGYLQFLAETGIIGLGLLIFFWILCFKKILKAYNISKDNFSKKVYLSSLGGIILLFVLSITENYFSSTTIMICLSILVSLAIGLSWQESIRDSHRKFT